MWKLMKKAEKNNKGFSLVELIVVIAIMAVLGVAIALAVTQFIPQANRSTDLSNANMLKEAAEAAITDELSNGGSVASGANDATLRGLINTHNTLGDPVLTSDANHAKIKGASTTHSVTAGSEFVLTYDGHSVTVHAGSATGTVLAGNGVPASYKTDN